MEDCARSSAAVQYLCLRSAHFKNLICTVSQSASSLVWATAYTSIFFDKFQLANLAVTLLAAGLVLCL